jgi:hypothetical protein
MDQEKTQSVVKTKRKAPRKKKEIEIEPKAGLKGMLWRSSVLSVLALTSLHLIASHESKEKTSGSFPFLSIETLQASDVAAFSNELPILTEQEKVDLEKFNDLLAMNDVQNEGANYYESEGTPTYYFVGSDSNNYVEPTPSVQVEEKVEEERKSRIQIGGDYTFLNFKPKGHSSFTGNLGGAGLSYEYKPLNRFYGALTFDWKEGKTTGDSGSRSILYFDTQEKAGYTFSREAKDWFLSLFSGFGYRYVGQTFDPSSGSSIRFAYNEFYFPVGLATEYLVNSYFSVGLRPTWMPQVFPTVSITPLVGARWNTTCTWTNFSVSMPFRFTLPKNSRFELTVLPFYQFWQDGYTTAKLSDGTKLGLPGNTYNYYGVNVDFGICF